MSTDSEKKVRESLNLFIYRIRILTVYCFIILFVICSIHDLNTLWCDYCLTYLNPIYDVLQGSENLFYVGLLCIFLYGLRMLYKQYRNQSVSRHRVLILILTIYVLYIHDDLNWVYVHHGIFNLNHIVFVYCVLSLLLEILKSIHKVRSFIDQVKVRLRKKLNIDNFIKYLSKFDSKGSNPDETLMSTSTREEELVDVGMDKYMDQLVIRLRSIDVTRESFAVGCVNPWGSGKTTFLKLLSDKLEKDMSFIVINFNP